jgi:hypothetical protein
MALRQLPRIGDALVRRVGLLSVQTRRKTVTSMRTHSFSTSSSPTTMVGSDGLPIRVPEPPPPPKMVEVMVEEARGFMEEVFDRYSELMLKHPIAGNAVVSGILCSLGDCIAQVVEWRQEVMSPDKKEFNFVRTARMATFGFFVCGPLLAVWYRVLGIATQSMQVAHVPVFRGRIAEMLERVNPNWEAVLHLKAPRKHSPAGLLIGKVVADSVLFQLPFLNLYFAFMGFLEGLPADQILDKTRDAFYRAWGIGFLVWGPVQAR